MSASPRFNVNLFQKMGKRLRVPSGDGRCKTLRLQPFLLTTEPQTLVPLNGSSLSLLHCMFASSYSYSDRAFGISYALRKLLLWSCWPFHSQLKHRRRLKVSVCGRQLMFSPIIFCFSKNVSYLISGATFRLFSRREIAFRMDYEKSMDFVPGVGVGADM